MLERRWGSTGHERCQHSHFLQEQGWQGDCNNYHGISLLNIIGKLFAKVVLIKLWVLAERIYQESQCGFRAKRATIDMISLRKLQEKCREQGKPLHWPDQDILQGENDCYLGYLLPTLLIVKKSMRAFINGSLVHAQSLASAVILGLQQRFCILFGMCDAAKEHILASITHPYFKMHWVPDDKKDQCRQAGSINARFSSSQLSGLQQKKLRFRALPLLQIANTTKFSHSLLKLLQRMKRLMLIGLSYSAFNTLTILISQ